MDFPRSKKVGAFFLGGNVALGLLAAWLIWGLVDGPGYVRKASPPLKIARNGAVRAEFPMRKASSPLADVLKRGAAFAARLDARSRPPRRASRRVERVPVRLAAVRPKRPAYDWSGLRLAGVVVHKGVQPVAAVRQAAPGPIVLRPRLPAPNYAVFEYRKTRKQVLVREGESLEGGAVVLRVEANRVVLGFHGERKVFEVSPEPPKQVRPPAPPPAIANITRPG